MPNPPGLPITEAKSIRADRLTAAYHKETPHPQLVKLWVCQWEKRLVKEFLLPGNVEAVGPAKAWTLEKVVGRFIGSVQRAHL